LRSFATAAVLCLVLAGCGGSRPAAGGGNTSRTANQSPVDVVRDLFAAEGAHNFTGFCRLVIPAARVELRASRQNPSRIGGPCAQHLRAELARGQDTPSNPIVGFGYTSLHTVSETGGTAIVQVKDEQEGVTGASRSYTMELKRCGSSWLWTLEQSGMTANPVAKRLFASIVGRYGCEPEAEVIRRRGVVVVKEDGATGP
jgi:hypothetical protein